MVSWAEHDIEEAVDIGREQGLEEFLEWQEAVAFRDAAELDYLNHLTEQGSLPEFDADDRGHLFPRTDDPEAFRDRDTRMPGGWAA